MGTRGSIGETVRGGTLDASYLTFHINTFEAETEVQGLSRAESTTAIMTELKTQGKGSKKALWINSYIRISMTLPRKSV